MEDTSKSLTRWLSIIGVLTGLVALGISWQANMLAREANSIALQQASGRLTVFDTEISGLVAYDTNDDNIDVTCTTRVRLANLGGAALTVTDFKATIQHLGEVTILESYGPGASSGLGVIPNEEFPNTWLEFQVIPEEIFRGRNMLDTGESSAVFPLKIEGAEVKNIFIRLDFQAEHAEPNFESSSNAIDTVGKPDTFEISYEFQTPTGQFVSTPFLVCASHVTLL